MVSVQTVNKITNELDLPIPELVTQHGPEMDVFIVALLYKIVEMNQNIDELKALLNL